MADLPDPEGDDPDPQPGESDTDQDAGETSPPTESEPELVVAEGALAKVEARLRRVYPLWRILTVREFRVRYRQSALDAMWSLINPVVVMAIYGVILSSALGVTGDGVPYLSFAWLGVVVWTFFSTGLASAMPSLVISADLLSKVYFPREAIPLAMVGATVIDLVIGMITVVILARIQGIHITLIAIAAIVPIVLIIIWTAALAMIGSVITVFLRDMNHGVQLILRVGFFATPVMYPAQQLPHWLKWTNSVNPAAVAIEALRQCILRHAAPDFGLLLIQIAIGLTLFVLGVMYTRAVEGRIVDVV